MLPAPQEIIGFIEIANSSNITKAANKMGVTQPTLSQSLKKLEHTVGEQLVIRSKNGIELTRAGKTFLKYAKQLLETWERVKLETQSSQSEVKGNVRFGCHPSVGLYTLDRFLPKLIQQYQQLEITLTHDLSRKIVDKVINFELDMGLAINPIKHPDLILIKILNDEVKIWKKKGEVPDILICHPELLQTQDILKKLKKKQSVFKRIITSNNLEIITKLTLQGAGHGVIPGRVVNLFDKRKSLQLYSGTSVFKDELYLVYRVENKNIEYIKKIRQCIVGSFA
jgi:DNA-binding transcriptional LysR family regulator